MSVAIPHMDKDSTEKFSQEHANSLTFDYKDLANAIIANTALSPDPFTYNPEFMDIMDRGVIDRDALVESISEVNGRSLKVGPFEVRPGLNQEVPLGRLYQPVQETSISRLAGYLGRDEYSLYIREVPDDADNGLRPSKTGIWVRDAGEESYRRLEPGEAVRINKETDLRMGGNGKDGSSGLQVFVV